MKKLNILIVVLLLLLCGCSGKKGYIEITYNELIKKIDSKQNFILMIGSSSCPHCDMFKLTIEELSKKYKININYIDITKLTDEENSTLKSYFPYKGTPMTINVVEGSEGKDARIEGDRDYSYTKEKLIKWGYIKE